MKTITLWQPWATLIAIGAKQYETRSWPTKHRGPLAIHAAIKKDEDSLLLCREEPFRSVLVAAGYEKIGDLPFGAVVATCNLVDCVPTSKLRKEFGDSQRFANELAFGDYSDGRFGWRLENIQRIEPTPARGAQGLWNWEA